MQRLGWNYVAIIYEADSFGKNAAEELKLLANTEKICTPLFRELPVVSNGAIKTNELQSIIKNITLSGIGGLVFLGSSNKASVLLTTIQGISTEIAETPSLIFSGDSLSRDVFVDDTNSVVDVGKGSFVVSPTQRQIPEFDSHWKSLFENTTLLLENTSSNSLLLDVFEEVTNCRPSNIQSCDATDGHMKTLSTISEYTSYAIEAAFVVAKSISLAVNRHCKSNNKCKPSDVLQAMESVSVNFRQDFDTSDFGDLVVQFYDNSIVMQDGIPIYDLYNFQNSADGFNLLKVTFTHRLCVK